MTGGTFKFWTEHVNDETKGILREYFVFVWSGINYNRVIG